MYSQLDGVDVCGSNVIYCDCNPGHRLVKGCGIGNGSDRGVFLASTFNVLPSVVVVVEVGNAPGKLINGSSPCFCVGTDAFLVCLL